MTSKKQLCVARPETHILFAHTRQYVMVRTVHAVAVEVTHPASVVELNKTTWTLFLVMW